MRKAQPEWKVSALWLRARIDPRLGAEGARFPYQQVREGLKERPDSSTLKRNKRKLDSEKIGQAFRWGETQRVGLPHCFGVFLASGGFFGGSHTGQSLRASCVTAPFSSEGDCSSAGSGERLAARGEERSREQGELLGLVGLNVGHICKGQPTPA